MKRVTDSMKLAKESKDKASIAELKAELRHVRTEKQRVQFEIKKATDENSLYYRAAKPYLDAVRTIAQSENYSRCEDIFALYDGAKVRENRLRYAFYYFNPRPPWGGRQQG